MEELKVVEQPKQQKPEWHPPTITIMDIRRTLQFCGSQEDALWGGKQD